MSSESPAPTGDHQEHTSRTSTPDGHDDDQSLGPEDDVIRRDISASQFIPSSSQSTSQSTPSTSQSSPSTSQSTSQSTPSTSQSIPSTSQSIPSIFPSARRSGAGERDIEMGPGSDPKYQP
ncbi:putative protein TPRXL [Gadus morhua]|uniref:putative protein TPRXL n=1 Tax=Gadus morhua TaxID=8049 RepID=UPI0011B6BB6A|nr:putative protein TPRXL [Gadus morhua]